MRCIVVLAAFAIGTATGVTAQEKPLWNLSGAWVCTKGCGSSQVPRRVRQDADGLLVFYASDRPDGMPPFNLMGTGRWNGTGQIWVSGLGFNQIATITSKNVISFSDGGRWERPDSLR